MTATENRGTDLVRLGYNTVHRILRRAGISDKPLLEPGEPMPPRGDGKIADDVPLIGYSAVWAAVWARPGLSDRDRSLVTLGALISMGLEDEIGSHVKIGLGNGLSRDEISEVIYHAGAYSGYPRSMVARKAARIALGET